MAEDAPAAALCPVSPADNPAAHVPAAGETVEFVFPWLEGLLRWLHL